MADLALLLDTYTDETDRVRAIVTELVRAQFVGLGSWRDADVLDFLDTVSPLIVAGQQQSAALTEAFLATVIADHFDEPLNLPAVPAPDYAELRNGAALSDVYTRPFITTRSALGDGQELGRAVDIGAERLDGTVQADMQLAERRAALNVIGPDDRVIGSRRALRPGASKTGSCGLCLAAASQRYKKQTLLPVHNRCHCKTVPVFRNYDPAVELNRRRFTAERERIKTEGQTVTRSQLTRVRVREHGELGPVLTDADQHFTTEREALAS